MIPSEGVALNKRGLFLFIFVAWNARHIMDNSPKSIFLEDMK